MKSTLMFLKKLGFLIDPSDLKKYGTICFYRTEKKTKYPFKQEIICKTLEDLISAVYICGLEDGKKEKANEICTAIKNL